jgi:UMF1 family MFS transporter
MAPIPRRRTLAWIVYDCATSSFLSVVFTYVIATYFVQAVAVDAASGTAQWAATQSIAGVLLVGIAPALGAVADRGNRRYPLLVASSLAMAGCTAMFWFIRPAHEFIVPALLLAGFGSIVGELAVMFHGALLTDCARPGEIGRVSGLGFGAGYFGGLTILVLCLVLFIAPSPPHFGLDPASAEPVRAATVLTALWILLFVLPILLFAPKASAHPTTTSLGAILDAARIAWRHPAILRYLIAHMLYNDGLITLGTFGAIFAAGTFHFTTTDILELGIGLNITAGIGAVLFSRFEDSVGAIRVLLVSLAALIALAGSLLLVQSALWFWVLALPIGLFYGPSQSASRSLMARLAPPDHANALFGLYTLSGRATGFVGPAALAAITGATGSQRAGMTVIVVLLGAGAVTLLGMRVAPAQTAAVSP